MSCASPSDEAEGVRDVAGPSLQAASTETANATAATMSRARAGRIGHQVPGRDGRDVLIAPPPFGPLVARHLIAPGRDGKCHGGASPLALRRLTATRGVRREFIHRTQEGHAELRVSSVEASQAPPGTLQVLEWVPSVRHVTELPLRVWTTWIVLPTIVVLLVTLGPVAVAAFDGPALGARCHRRGRDNEERKCAEHDRTRESGHFPEPPCRLGRRSYVV